MIWLLFQMQKGPTMTGTIGRETEKCALVLPCKRRVHEKTPSIFHGITGANTICDQRYDDTSSLSLCQRIWTKNIKS